MTNKMIDTGFPELDSDYKEFWSFVEYGGLEKLSTLASQQSVRQGDFLKAIGNAPLRFAMHLMDDDDYSLMRQSVSSDSVNKIEEAAEFINEHVRPLLQSESIKPFVFPPSKVEEPSDPQQAAQQFNTINKIHGFPSWMAMKDGPVFPTIRFHFYSGEKLLLDSTMDWDDTSFAVESLLSELVRDFERYERITALDSEEPLPEGLLNALANRLNTICRRADEANEWLKKFRD